MPATLTTTIGKAARKSALRLLLSFLAIFLTATFFVACGKNVDEGGGGGGSGGGGGKGTSDYKKGISALEKGEYEEAAEAFRKAAEKGNAEAMFGYSLCLRAGKGVEKDKDEADKWLKKAADAGDAMAQAFYGASLTISGTTKKEGLDYLEKSADQGCVFGQFGLVGAYANGSKSGPSEKQMALMKKAASQPLTDKKVLPDYFEEDFFWTESLLKSMDLKLELKGNKNNFSNVFIVVSQIMLGAAYMEKGDFAEAKKWLHKAGNNGLSQADDLLKQVEKAEKESKSKKR